MAESWKISGSYLKPVIVKWRVRVCFSAHLPAENAPSCWPGISIRAVLARSSWMDLTACLPPDHPAT